VSYIQEPIRSLVPGILLQRSDSTLMFSRSITIINMADSGKRRYRSWIYSSEAKVPKTTAWRRKQKESTRISLSSTNSNDEETSRSDRCDFSESSLDKSVSVDVFESDQCFPRCCSSPINCEPVVESLPCNSNKEDSLDEFFSVVIDKESNSEVSDTDDSDGVQDLWETDSSFSSDHERDNHDEASSSDGITDTECSGKQTNNDDNVPLYEGAKVSRLGALIVVMLFSLRHQLSGRALTDLVKVICSLLPDGHTFVASAYLLKKYFADFFGEPAPKKHFYCGNCLGRVKNDQTQCSKEKCRNAKKKIEYFLEFDLRLRLCQLFRGK